MSQHQHPDSLRHALEVSSLTPARAFLRLLREHMPPHALLLIAGSCASIIAAAATAAQPWLIHSLFNDVITSNDRQLLVIFTLVFIGAVLLRAASSYIGALSVSIVGRRVVADIQTRLAQKLAFADFSWTTETHSSRLANTLVSDARAVEISVSASLVTLVREGFSALFLAGSLLFINTTLALIVLGVLPPIVLFVRTQMHIASRRAAAQLDAYSLILSATSDMLRGAREIRSHANEDFALNALKQRIQHALRASISTMRVIQRVAPVTETISSIAILAVLLFAAHAIQNNTLTLADLLAFLTALALFFRPMRSFSQVHVLLQEGFAAAQRVYAVLDQKPVVADAPNAVELNVSRGAVTVRDLSFQYLDSPTIQSLSVTFPPGKISAVVGPSGAGKTTLLNLIMRFHDPSNGSVSIDDQNVKSLSIKSLRQSISLVTQDPFLFHDTVANNIALAKPDASIEEIQRAATLADAHDFIRELPDQYQCILTEGGSSLSGGQRQRIALARAALKGAPILLMDEPTSQLDPQTEARIHKSMLHAPGVKTCIVVAHRLGIAKRADAVFVLNHGRLVESGDHESLLQQNGLYAQLLRASQEIP